ncbi:DUF6164 family protein [Pseudohalioglobus lutimaris]|uniref:DUF2007 domain-containing protein n=1 Tax=Pseudohalioglobus lutimaris TaxID=1737061 RepID=A0A2N5X4D5_9GAMM|nr:DUF6164 family protein [Pseudohalioglobus lutimaris]PLW69347.1 hypothetical protein C0039_07380 [Pseudohalioglobus lutimaris]
MAVLIFRLNGVSDEEAQDIRNLLTDNALDSYETSAGRWGVSVAGLWLVNENDKARARELIDAYQLERQRYFEELKIEAPPETFSERFRQSPLNVIFYSVLAVTVLFLTLSPFIKFLSD